MSEDAAFRRLPTIVDVAELAGVSVSTVSRVLNDRSDVSPRTRAKIQAAIAELEFAPRVSAQRLVGGRSHTVSMLFPKAYGQWSNYELDFLLGAANATSGRNYFFHLAPETLSPADFRALYASGAAEGAILLQITEDDWRVSLAMELGFPCVMIGRTAFDHGVSWVDFDFEGAVGAMMDHLAHIGHRSIGFIGRPAESLAAGLGSSLRLQRGFQDAVDRLNLVPHTMASDLDPISAGQTALSLIDSAPEITAIVATNGRSAGGIMHALRGRGLRVPDDVSVLTIATPSLAVMTTPELSGVDFPSAELGFHAANVLVRRLDELALGQPQRTERILLPAHLTLRGTTAPVSTR